MARPKPISASNPPLSRGDRGAKDEGLLAVEEKEVPKKTPQKKAVSQPTLVEQSPAADGETRKFSTTRKNSRGMGDSGAG